jgi:hypothetical protein
VVCIKCDNGAGSIAYQDNFLVSLKEKEVVEPEEPEDPVTIIV